MSASLWLSKAAAAAAASASAAACLGETHVM